MTTTLVSKPNWSLLPAECTCGNCEAITSTNDFADFNYNIGGEDTSPYVTIACKACGNGAYPSRKLMDAYVKSYKLWQASVKSENIGVWDTRFWCNECTRTSTINRSHITVRWEGANFGGDHPEPVVNITCPVCNSLSHATGNIPSGIEAEFLIAANKKSF